jgi:hypothetical protein
MGLYIHLSINFRGAAQENEMGTRTRIGRIFADQIRGNPLNLRHPRSHWCRFCSCALLLDGY